MRGPLAVIPWYPRGRIVPTTLSELHMSLQWPSNFHHWKHIHIVVPSSSLAPPEHVPPLRLTPMTAPQSSDTGNVLRSS